MLSKARICALRRNEYTKGAIQVRRASAIAGHAQSGLSGDER